MKEKGLLTILSSFRHLFEDVVHYPNIILTDMKALPSSTKKIYPCDIIDLRKILSEEMIEGDKYIPLFSINFSNKYLKKYPIFLLLDEKDKKAIQHGGVSFYETPMDIENILLSVIVNEPVDKEVEERVRRIIADSGISVECISHNSIPGLSSQNPRLSRTAQVKDNIKIELTPIEEKIFDFLMKVKNHFGLSTKLRVAGGWVRDKILGLSSDDIDIALENMTGKQFVDYIKQYPDNQAVGKDYTVDQNVEKSKHLETAGINIYGQKIEFVNLRSEIYTETRIPEMKMGDVESDAKRRDLTINALFYNLETGRVEDYVGGLNDLKNKVLRTPLDPVETFKEDPLRALRALRFKSKFGGFALDKELVEALKNPEVQQAYKSKVSTERAGPEIMKMMMGENPVDALRVLFETDLYKSVFDIPEMEEVVPEGIKMDQKSSHHKYNLMNHTLEVIKNMDNIMRQNNESDKMRGLMNLAATFHDFGKMKSDIQVPHKNYPQYMSYIHHEDASARMADDILKSIGVGKDDRDIVNQVVKLHMKPHLSDEMSSRGKGRFLRKSRLPGKEEEHKDLWKYIFYHARADEMSTIPENFDTEKSQQRFDNFENYVNSPRGSVQQSIISGHDIMAIIPEIKPNTGFIKEIQERIQEMQDSGEIDVGFIALPEGPEKVQAMEFTKQQALSVVQEMKPELLNKYRGPKMASNWYKKVISQVLPSSPYLDPDGTITEYLDKGEVKGPKMCKPPFEVGMKIRDRRKGAAFPQEYGVVLEVDDKQMKIEWIDSKNKKNKEQIYNLDDTISLHSLIAKV